jgi:glycosyltransferase involved in cell wall biosynthesis
MKIAVWHNLLGGGAKRALYCHVRGLVALGHHVEVWCPSTADPAYLPLNELAPEHVLPVGWQPAPPASRIGALLHAYRKLPDQRRAMDLHCREAAAQIDRGQFDALFANSCQFFASAPIARFASTPSLLYLQEPNRVLYESLARSRWLAPPAGASGLQRVGYALVIRARARSVGWLTGYETANAAAFDRILVNSRFSRESVLRAYGLDSTVCYLGVDVDPAVVPEARREPFVVGLGSLTHGKGVDRAVRALGAIEASRRPRLEWIANFVHEAYREEVERLAAAEGVAVAIRVGVTDAELTETLRRAALMLYTPRLEPFGFAPLEANACGTPVVGIAEGGVRESVRHGENGLLVSDDDPAALGQAVLRLLEAPGEAREMGMRGRELAQAEWSWEAAASRLERALQAVAAGGGSGRERRSSPCA